MCEYLFSVLCIEFAAVVKEEEFPEFYGWVERMKGTDAVKGSYQSPEAHLAFIKSVKAGVHDYSHADVTGQGITIYAMSILVLLCVSFPTDFPSPTHVMPCLFNSFTIKTQNLCIVSVFLQVC